MPSVTPWWEHLSLRDEITSAKGNVNDVQMSLFRSVYQPEAVPYSDPAYYSDITFPTDGLVDLLASVAVRLGTHGNAAAKPVWRGDQAMGGGKSHGLVGLHHMASNAAAFRATDLGALVWARAAAIADEDLPDDLNKPKVVVLSCDEMDPFKPNKDLDGIAETLGERWLWRLVDENTEKYKSLRDQLGTKSGIESILRSLGRPVLTLIDEILDYIQKATASDDQTRATQDDAFIRSLLEATTRCDNAAVVIVMISSNDDRVALTDNGEKIRDDLEGQMTKFASVTTTTTGGDFASIIRRRLFEQQPDPQIMKDTAQVFTDAGVKGSGWLAQFDSQPWWKAGAWDAEVQRCYPFHPDVMTLVGREWANQAGFQKVRSTLQIFAATVWAQAERAAKGEWTPLLIGLGDLPLSDAKTRESITNSGVISDPKTRANFREIAMSDIVANDDDSGVARTLDKNRESDLFTVENPRAAERMATALFILSLAPRSQGATGATEAELHCASFVPTSACSLPAIEAIRQTLEDTNSGLATLDSRPGQGGNARRLLLSTRQTLPMFYRQQRDSITDEEVNAILRSTTEKLAQSGPFNSVKVISAEDVDLSVKGQPLTDSLVAALDAAGVDDGNKNRLYVLDPSGFTLLNGQDSETRQAIGAALGLKKPAAADPAAYWPEPLSVAWAASAVFCVVNTYKRSTAKASAKDLLAWQRVAQIPSVSEDETLKAQTDAEIRDHRATVEKHVKDAFQHVVYLSEIAGEDGVAGRIAATIKIDKNQETALNGAHVWAYLTEADKAFGKDEFTGEVLKFNLDSHAQDWGQPLSHIRNNYYKTPRLALLHDGDNDLKRAIFALINTGDAELANADGDAVPVSSAAEINVASAGLLLRRPKTAETVVVPDFHAQTVDAAKAMAEAAGVVIVVDGDGVVQGQNPAAGTWVPVGSMVNASTESSNPGPAAPVSTPAPIPASTPAQSSEKQVNVSAMGLTFGNEATKEATFQMFTKLAEAVDSGQISFAKFQIEVTGEAASVESIHAQAQNAGFNPSIQDV